MLDEEETRATKLGEAPGLSTRVSRWLAGATQRSAQQATPGLVWFISTYPNTSSSLFRCSLYMGGAVGLSQAVLLLIIRSRCTATERRQLSNKKDFSLMMDGIANDLDNLEQRIEKDRSPPRKRDKRSRFGPLVWRRY